MFSRTVRSVCSDRYISTITSNFSLCFLPRSPLSQYLCHVSAVWMCQHCDCRWVLLFSVQCSGLILFNVCVNIIVNTVRISNVKICCFIQMGTKPYLESCLSSCHKAFHSQSELICSLSHIAVLISLSSGMPNHSASIQVSPEVCSSICTLMCSRDHNPFHSSWTTMHAFTKDKVTWSQASKTHKAIFFLLADLVTVSNAWKSNLAPSNIGPISPTFVCLDDTTETGVEKVLQWCWLLSLSPPFSLSVALPPSLQLCFSFSLSFSLSLSLPLQLCVQKLRILIEDSDQNCEPSVNACSVSFSHCLRVSGIVHLFRLQQRRPHDSG